MKSLLAITHEKSENGFQGKTYEAGIRVMMISEERTFELGFTKLMGHFFNGSSGDDHFAPGMCNDYFALNRLNDHFTP